MGKPVIGALMIFMLLITTALITEHKIHRDALNEIKLATKIASRSACMAIDYDITAEKGYIVLDEEKSRSEARDFFFNNLNRLSAEEVNLDIYVINDAPGWFNIYDQNHYFTSNGVAVGYHYNGAFLFSVDEVDDFY